MLHAACCMLHVASLAALGRLAEVDVSGCAEITADGVLQLALGCPQVRAEVRKCPVMVAVGWGWILRTEYHEYSMRRRRVQQHATRDARHATRSRAVPARGCRHDEHSSK